MKYRIVKYNDKEFGVKKKVLFGGLMNILNMMI
jgi:hypothetical protein